MLFPCEQQIGHRNPPGAQGINHHLGLVGQHDLVLIPLQEEHGTGDAFGSGQRRPLLVDVRLLRVPAHQRIQISGLELVGLPGQGTEVADPEVANPDMEPVGEGQAGQRGEAARATAGNRQPLTIGQPLFHQMGGCIGAVLDIHQAPGPIQAPAIGRSIAGAAAIVDIHHREAAASPVLNLQIQVVTCLGSGAAMALDPERRQFTFGNFVFGIGRRIVPGMSRLTAFRFELDGLGHRVERRIHIDLIRGPEFPNLPTRQVQKRQRGEMGGAGRQEQTVAFVG